MATVTDELSGVTYTVTFTDWDDIILKIESVTEGGSATAPTDPTRDGYIFTGWDKSFNNITSDLTITALYESQDIDLAVTDLEAQNIDGLILFAEYKFTTSVATTPTMTGSTPTYVDTDNGDGTTTRKIYVDKLPTDKNMFRTRTGLLEVYYLDLSNATDIQRTFYGCTNLTKVDVPNLVQSKHYQLLQMFYGCEKLEVLNTSNWIINGQSIQIFQNCTALKEIEVKNWTNTSHLCQYFFDNCTSLETVKLPGFNITSTTAWDSTRFFGANNSVTTKLKYLDLSNTNYKVINQLIGELPTRTANDAGTLVIAGVDNESQVNKAAAEAKFWNVISVNEFLVAQYTTNAAGVVPTFNSGYEYRVEETVNNGIYTVKIYSSNDFTSCSFSNKSSLLTVDYLKVTNKVTSMTRMFNICSNLTYVNTSGWDTSNVTDMSYMFWMCHALPSIDVSSFNTAKVTNMRGMFGTTSTNGMALRTITGLEKWNTGNVGSMAIMFQLCKNLTSLETGIANWNVGKVTDMSAMLRNCSSITSLDLSKWRPSLVTNIQQLFYDLTQMTTLNISNWIINQVTNYNYLFTNCNALHTVIMHNSNAVSINHVITQVPHRDTQCILEVDGVDNINNVELMLATNKGWYVRYNGEFITLYIIAMYAFDSYNTPDEIIVPAFNEGFEYQVGYETMDVFDGTWSNGSINLSNGQDISATNNDYVRSDFIKLHPSTQYYFMGTEGAVIFYYDINKNLISYQTPPEDSGFLQGYLPDNCEYVRAIKKNDANSYAYCINETMGIVLIASTSLPTKISFEDKEGLEVVYYLNMSEANTMENMFKNCTNFKGIKNYPELYLMELGEDYFPLRDWKTSKVTNMANAFYNCPLLSTLDINISDWNTSKVTTTNNMFYNCDSLTSIDLSNWNTDSLINCADMFNECINLESIDLENWTTPKLQLCNGMFVGCRKLTNLNISNFNTSNVTLMGAMFKNCNALASLDLSHFNTSKTTAMHTVFQGCDSLVELDLSTWNTSNVNDFNHMLSCAKLTTLKLNTWSIKNTANTANLFRVSTNLKSIEMKNTNSTSVNKVIEQLLTRTAEDPGSLNIAGVDNAAQVNVTSAQSKYWNIKGAYCTVVFKDWDGSILKTESVILGASASAPNVPNREGYIFTGWDKDFSNVTGDLVVTAQYSLKPSYTVTFVDWDGTVLKTQTVMEGSSAIAPNNPYREGYIFVGWNTSLDNVLSNLIVEAQYIIKSKIKVTFLNWNGSILKEEQVYENESVTPPEAPTRIGYDFIGWDKSSNKIVKDTIINAVFSIKTFFVQFRDYNGIVLDEQRIDYNNSAVLPIEPIREGYTFTGWDKSLNNITSDTIIVAQYSKKAEVLHTVVFKDWNGSILSTQEIEHGGSANGIPNPVRNNYIFSGWDNKLINITSDMTITAQYLYLGDFADALSGVNFNNMSINKLSINGKDVNALYVGDEIILILKSQFFK